LGATRAEETVMNHVSRLDQDLQTLLRDRPVAALGTLDDEGAPFVSMVPYAIEPALGELVLHVSGLAAHSRHLRERPVVSLMVMGRDDAADMPQALPRVTIAARAEVLEPGSPAARACEAVYLARFPEAELMTGLPDFRFVLLHASGARHVAGFGAARSVEAPVLESLLRLA